MNVRSETTGFKVKRETVSHMENATAACPLGNPPLKGVPLLNIAFIIIIPTKTMEITTIEISEPAVFSISKT
jgi:hypothetical protein